MLAAAPALELELLPDMFWSSERMRSCKRLSSQTNFPKHQDSSTPDVVSLFSSGRKSKANHPATTPDCLNHHYRFPFFFSPPFSEFSGLSRFPGLSQEMCDAYTESPAVFSNFTSLLFSFFSYVCAAVRLPHARPFTQFHSRSHFSSCSPCFLLCPLTALCFPCDTY